MSTWKLLEQIMGEGPRDYTPGMRTNSIWNRAAELERQPSKAASPPGKPQGPKGPATGPVVWRGAQMKDSDLFNQKKDKNSGQSIETGLISALKQAGGTVSRAPDGSGIAIIPNGYRIDTSVWKDWSSNRARAEINATTDSVKGVGNPMTAKTAVKTYDVLIQARSSGDGDSPSIMVTKVVWAQQDKSSVEAQQPEARQAKLELLMDTDDPSELAQMFPANQGGQGLQKLQQAELPPNPLMAPSKVSWSKGGTSAPAARDSSWDDIDLGRVPKRR